jgi:hypothetical protein
MKKTMIVRFCVVALCLVSPAGFAKVLAVWDFGPSSAFYTTEPASYALSAKPTLVMTGGDIDTNGKNGVDFTDADSVFHVAGQGAAWDDINKSGSDNDAACTITLNTTGWLLQGLRWDYKSEKATSYDIDYRLSETATWIQLLDNQPITADNLFHAVTIDLSAFAALSNQPFMQILISDLDEGPGNDKYTFDNLQFTGVPEPASLSLLLLGAAMGLRRRR